MKKQILIILLLSPSFSLSMEKPPHKPLDNKAEQAQEELLLASIRGNGNKAKIKSALSKGANIDIADVFPNPLHTVCLFANKPQNIALLLAHGANPNITMPETGLTPLQSLKVLHSFGKITGSQLLPCSFLLVAAGANPHEPMPKPESVLGKLVRQPAKEALQGLMKRISRMGKPLEKKSKDILTDIYNFQIEELQTYNNALWDPQSALKAFKIKACLVGHDKKSPTSDNSLCFDPIYLQHLPQSKVNPAESLVGKKLTPKELKLELRANTHKLNTPNRQGKTLLMEAAKESDIQRLNTLINSGADIYATDNDNNTALDAAASSGSLTCIRSLLQEYDRNQKNQRHMPQIPEHMHPPIVNILQHSAELATKSGHSGCAQLLFYYNNSDDPFFLALLSNDWDTLQKEFSSNPAKINETLDVPRCPALTPFEWAELIKDDKLKFKLEEMGAKLHNKELQDTLAEGIRFNIPHKIEKAFSKGVLLNTYDSKGSTPLHWACCKGNPSVIVRLINSGADLNIYDREKHRSGLNWLLRMHDRSVKKEGRQISTSEFLPCLFLLVRAGADTKIVDAFGDNLHDWILKQGFNQEEFNLVSDITFMHQIGKPSQGQIIEAIYDFQKRELIEAEKINDADKVNAINAALVAEEKDGKIIPTSHYELLTP